MRARGTYLATGGSIAVVPLPTALLSQV